MNKVVVIVVVVVAAALLFMRQKKISTLQAQNAKLAADVAAARQEAQRAAETPKVDPKEQERRNQELAELARLRGEVSALRKEKADWQKNRGAAETAALNAAQPAPPAP